MPRGKTREIKNIYTEVQSTPYPNTQVIEETPPREFEENLNQTKSAETSEKPHEGYLKEAHSDKTNKNPTTRKRTLAKASEREAEPTTDDEQSSRPLKAQKTNAKRPNRRKAKKNNWSSRKRTTAPPKQKSDTDLWNANCIIAEDIVNGRYLVEWEGIDPKTKKPYEASWVSNDCANEALIQSWELDKIAKVKNPPLFQEPVETQQSSIESELVRRRRKLVPVSRLKTRRTAGEVSSPKLLNTSKNSIKSSSQSLSGPVSSDTTSNIQPQSEVVEISSQNYPSPPKVVIETQKIPDSELTRLQPSCDKPSLRHHSCPISLESCPSTQHESTSPLFITSTSEVLEGSYLPHTVESIEKKDPVSSQASGENFLGLPRQQSCPPSSQGVCSDTVSDFQTQVPYVPSQGHASQHPAPKLPTVINLARRAEEGLRNQLTEVSQPSSNSSLKEGTQESASSQTTRRIKKIPKSKLQKAQKDKNKQAAMDKPNPNPTPNVALGGSLEDRELQSGHLPNRSQFNQISPNEAHSTTGDVAAEALNKPKDLETPSIHSEIYYLPITLSDDAQKWYTDLFKARKNLLRAFQAMKSVPDTETVPLTEEARRALSQFHGVLTHPDLIEDEAFSQTLTRDPKHRMQRHQSSSKFSFLAELAKLLKGTKTKIFVFATPGRLMEMLEGHFRDHFIPYRRPDVNSFYIPGNKRKRNPEEFEVVILASRISEIGNVDMNTLGQPNLIIGLEESFKASDPFVDEIRKNSMCPVVQLVVPNGADHVFITSKTLPPRERLYEVLRRSLLLHSAVGTNSHQPKGPEHLAKIIASAMKSNEPDDWKQVSDTCMDLHSTGRSLSMSQPESIEEQGDPSRNRKRRREGADVEGEQSQRPSPFNPASAPLLQERARNQSNLSQPNLVAEQAGEDIEDSYLKQAAMENVIMDDLKRENWNLMYKIRMIEAERILERESWAEKARSYAALQPYLEERSEKANELMGEAYKRSVEASKMMTRANKIMDDVSKMMTRANKAMDDAKALVENNKKGKKPPAKRNTNPRTDAENDIPREPSEGDSTVNISSSELTNLQTKADRADKLEKLVQSKEQELEYLRTQYNTATGDLETSKNQTENLQKENQYLQQQASGEISKVKSMSIESATKKYDSLLKQTRQERDMEKRHNERLVRALDVEKAKALEAEKKRESDRGMADSTRASNSPFRLSGNSQRPNDNATLSGSNTHRASSTSVPSSNSSRRRG